MPGNRCARRNAGTHSDALEHLLWLHSSSGSLKVMNARRLFHLEKAGASVALEIARQDVLLADIRENISLSTLDMARCVRDFNTVRVMLIYIYMYNISQQMKTLFSCKMTEHGYIKITVSDVHQPGFSPAFKMIIIYLIP